MIYKIIKLIASIKKVSHRHYLRILIYFPFPVNAHCHYYLVDNRGEQKIEKYSV